ncbi:MAG: cation:dicarboxylase symporter family transporter [Chitinophagales bacterium]|nr:cation:dicarboxylase symporter family transporter [Chitinophagales bacterium]MDW8392861.1 cation:dicarboxylase symporter family transporter [Chitinophagales bacterium]
MSVVADQRHLQKAIHATGNRYIRRSDVMRVVTLLLLTVATLAALLHVVDLWTPLAIHPWVLRSARWLAIAVLFWWGWKRKSLTSWILIFLVAGFELGYSFPQAGQHLKILSDIFLRLIKTIIAPLLFGTLVSGIAGHGNLKQVGRLGWKSILYYEIVTTLALIVGLLAINLSGAGRGIDLSGVQQSSEVAAAPQSARDIILHVFPENIAKAIAEGQVLQIVVFSILFGIGLSLVDHRRREPMLQFAESLSEVMFKFTNLVMYFAPFAVFGAIAYTIGKYGLGVFHNLLALLLTLYVALIAFVVLVLVPVMLIARVPVRRFIRAASEPFTLAFATASSESALPIALENMERMGVPRKIVAFVLPTGYSFNLDGTTLYLALASVFVAQAAGVELTIGQQVVMMLTLMLTSKGVAGVPRASLVILSGTVASFGLPMEPIFLILGIDALMDMARTSVNVLGNCLASVVIARWEGEFDDEAVFEEAPGLAGKDAAAP